MILDAGPCPTQSEPLQFALAALNVVQVLFLAYVAARAKRKNDEENAIKRNGQPGK